MIVAAMCAKPQSRSLTPCMGFVTLLFSICVTPLQETRLKLLKQQTKRDLQKQFDEQIHQVITKKDQEAAELRRQLELVKGEMKTEKEKLQKSM